MGDILFFLNNSLLVFNFGRSQEAHIDQIPSFLVGSRHTLASKKREGGGSKKECRNKPGKEKRREQLVWEGLSAGIGKPW